MCKTVSHNVDCKKPGRNYGPIVYMANNPARIDETSTELVANVKRVVHRQATASPSEYLWEMEEDFALDTVEYEEETPVAAARPSTLIMRASTSTTTCDHDEWMDLSQDFARDDSHVDHVVVRPSVRSLTQENAPIGEYNMWW